MSLNKMFRELVYKDVPNDGSGGGLPAPPVPPEPPAPPAKIFTQEDLDAQIGKRLARERANWEKEQKEAAETASLTEAEKLKQIADDAKKALDDAQKSTNERIVRTEAKIALIAAGANPARVDALIKLADLSAVTVDDKTGEPDAVLLKKAVDDTIQSFPEFKAGAGASGADFSSGNNADSLTEEKILEMTPAEMKKNMPAIETFYKHTKR